MRGVLLADCGLLGFGCTFGREFDGIGAFGRANGLECSRSTYFIILVNGGGVLRRSERGGFEFYKHGILIMSAISNLYFKWRIPEKCLLILRLIGARDPV